MRRFALPLATFMLLSPALAQEPAKPGFFERIFGATEEAETEEDPGGFLERLIEDNLSGEGRDVAITGFSGALSGRATLESMTISDEDGTWLTLEDVVLDWNRTAILRGRIEIAELSAASISLPRLPRPVEDTTPAPEASGFALPELPVSIEIGKIEAASVDIGAPVFGAETLASVSGSLSLKDGNGASVLNIQRLNGDGQLSLDAGYANSTQVLKLDLSLSEGADGILANMIDLPGRPSLEFSITGEAPVSAYAADIRLATDGAERLSGRISTAIPDGVLGAKLQVTADVGGDVAPIFAPAYQPFFGPNVALKTVVTTFEDGRLLVDNLSLAADALDLQGRIEIAPTGLPERIDLDGRIASRDAGPVLLPLSGPETRVNALDLVVAFDAAVGEAWTGSFRIEGLDRPGFAAERLNLDGSGLIKAGTSRSVSASLTFDATALDLGNQDAEAAIGETVTGGVDIRWSDTTPLELSGLRVIGETYALNGGATVTFSEAGPTVEGVAEVRASDLSAFSGLAQRTLGGSATLRTRFAGAPLAGTFDISAEGQTTDLVVSQPEADRVLAGNAEMSVSARRDEGGLSVSVDYLRSPNANISGRAQLRTGASELVLDAELSDAALVMPDLSGAVRAEVAARETDGVWTWTADTDLPGASLIANGTARDLMTVPFVTATGRLSADDLSVFAKLARRPIGGRVDTAFEGEATADLNRAKLVIDGVFTDVTTGIDHADAFLAGPVRIAVDAALEGDAIEVVHARVDGAAVQVDASGALTRESGQASLMATIADASRHLPGAPTGPLELRLETLRGGSDWDFDAKASGAALILTAQGTLVDPTGTEGAVRGLARIEVPEAGAFSGLTGRELAGRLALAAQGETRFDLTRFNVGTTLSAQGLSIGQPQADRLLAGKLDAVIDASRDGDAIRIGTLSLNTSLLSVAASGELGSEGSQMTVSGRLADVAPFAPGFAGPLTVKGVVGQSADGRFLIDVDAEGPGGATATVDGSAAPDISSVDLSVAGAAPLGLANGFIEPRSVSGTAAFDLVVKGPPALSSVAGQIASSNSRFVAPALGVTLEDIDLGIALGQSVARLDMSSKVGAGGSLAVNGPIALSAPFNADLGISLQNAVFSDPRLYETTVNGSMTLTGPLRGGARIAGTLELDETNIRIPSTGLGGAGDVPQVIHINEPPPVRGTRARAGLLETADGRAGAGPGFPLDIRVLAPNRIFVRGRGLDSEFGGEVRVTGTTGAVTPIGAFDLIRGRLDILGQRLDLEEATITMQGSFVPSLRIRAATRSDDVTIVILVLGPANAPDIEFTSEPELPEEEVLARLIFGRGIDTLSPLQAARLALAVRTLAGRGGEGIVGNIRDGAGLADFDVSTDEEGNAEVSAGTYLGDNIYTDLSVNAEGETRLNLNFDLTPSITLKGSAANTGESSVGVFFERDY